MEVLICSLTVCDAAGTVSAVPSRPSPGLGARKGHPARNGTKSGRKCPFSFLSFEIKLTPSFRLFPGTLHFLPSWRVWRVRPPSGNLCTEPSTVTPGAGLCVSSPEPPSHPLSLCNAWCNKWDLRLRLLHRWSERFADIECSVRWSMNTASGGGVMLI